MVGAGTGRPSSKEPNLQNIHNPNKHPGTLLQTLPLKNLFTHTFEGGGIAQMDLSQIELRVLACESASTSMLQMFREGRDIHRMTASQLYGVPEEQVTKSQRDAAKAVNFGIPYGRGWETIARDYHLEDDEARHAIARWMAVFPEVQSWQERTKQFATQHGYSISPFGRKRYIPFLSGGGSDVQKREAERQAINHPIQSGATDILLMGMVILHDIMTKHGMQTMMINTVHDSAVFDYHPDELTLLAHICRDVYANFETYVVDYFPQIDIDWIVIPLASDVDVGSHYGNLKPIEEELVA